MCKYPSDPLQWGCYNKVVSRLRIRRTIQAQRLGFLTSFPFPCHFPEEPIPQLDSFGSVFSPDHFPESKHQLSISQHPVHKQGQISLQQRVCACLLRISRMVKIPYMECLGSSVISSANQKLSNDRVFKKTSRPTHHVIHEQFVTIFLNVIDPVLTEFPIVCHTRSDNSDSRPTIHLTSSHGS